VSYVHAVVAKQGLTCLTCMLCCYAIKSLFFLFKKFSLCKMGLVSHMWYTSLSLDYLGKCTSSLHCWGPNPLALPPALPPPAAANGAARLPSLVFSLMKIDAFLSSDGEEEEEEEEEGTTKVNQRRGLPQSRVCMNSMKSMRETVKVPSFLLLPWEQLFLSSCHAFKVCDTN